MPVKYSDQFLSYAIQMIESGISLREFCKINSCYTRGLYNALKKRYDYVLPSTRKIEQINAQSVDIIRAYENGESVLSLSIQYEISRQVIGKIIKESGIVLRNGSSASKLRMKSLTVEQRKSITVHARKSRIENLGVKAATNKISYDLGQGEKELFEILFLEDIHTERQHVIGPYSIDIVYRNIAVEIKFRTKSGIVDERDIKRLEKIIEGDLIPCYIFINFAQVFHFCAGQILALLDFISSLKPIQGQYWMIECRAQYLPIMQDYVDNISPMTIPPQIKTSISQRYFGIS